MITSSFQSEDSDEPEIVEPEPNGCIPRSRRLQGLSFGNVPLQEEVGDEYTFPPGIPDDLKCYVEQFEQRKKSKAFEFFDNSINPEKVIEESPILSIDGVSVLLAQIATVLPAKSLIQKYIHTWENLSKVNSVEANRNIGAYFITQYNKYGKFDEKLVRSNLVEINWAGGIFSYGSMNSSQSLRIFHYVGLGFPAPRDGKICSKGNGFSSDDWSTIGDVIRTTLSNIHFIFDCDKAASLSPYIIEDNLTNKYITAMFACRSEDVLHIPETIPQNIFSCILLSPNKSVRELIPHISNMSECTLTSLIDLFTDAIAKDKLDQKTYVSLFQSPPLYAALWRHFLLAQKLMKQFGIRVRSIPELPDCSEHPLWQQFYYSLRCSSEIQFNFLMDIYSSRFLSRDALPPKTVLAFMSSLVKNDNVYEKVLQCISTFMCRSPQNCSLLAPFIETKYIGERRITHERSIEGMRAWNIIMSGMLLVFPKSSKCIANYIGQGGSAMSITSSLETDDIVRRYFISTIVSLCNAQTFIAAFFGYERSVVDYYPVLFSSQTSPETRMMIVVLMNLILSRAHASPSSSGPLGIHVILKLLMKEDNAIIRALAVSMLGFLMDVKSYDFNTSILKIALPAAIDGSFRVRRVFVSVLYLYIKYGGELKNNAILSVKDILEDNVEDVEGILGELTAILASDPSDIVRSEAVDVQSVSKEEKKSKSIDDLSNEKGEFYLYGNSDIVRSEAINFQSFSEEGKSYSSSDSSFDGKDKEKDSPSSRLFNRTKELQDIAHCSLFSQHTASPKYEQRYPDAVIDRGNLELFEVLPAEGGTGAISSLSFDRDHISPIYGSISGTVIWGDDKWRACSSSVTSVHHFGGSCIAAGSSSGYVYILKRGYQKPVDYFQACFGRSGPKTFISGDSSATDALISTGGNEIVHWDLASLKPISHTTLNSPLVCCARNNNEYVASLWNGNVVKYDVRTMEVTRVLTSERGREPIRVGFHCNKLYCSSESGPFIFYDDDRIVFKSETWSRATDIILHPTLDRGIIIGGEVALIDSKGNKIATMNTESRGRRCCFDGERPLAAIGNDNGTVAIWRIPK